MKGGQVSTKRQVATSARVDHLAKKIERELSWYTCLGSIVYENIETWLVDSGSSCHMMGLRTMFFSFIEIDSNYYVHSSTNAMHVVKGLGYVRFQLNSREPLDMVETLFVLKININFLLV